MAMKLVALDGGSDILVERRNVLIGRHPACDARIDSLRVSRHHCILAQEDGELTVRDLGSTNGIRINGMRIEVGRLQPGDELSIAHLRYRLDELPDNEPGIPSRPPLDDLLSPTSRIGFNSGN
jgi:pSer/pThr/pTyr-binding forkhead associated (FHA) protein